MRTIGPITIFDWKIGCGGDMVSAAYSLPSILQMDKRSFLSILGLVEFGGDTGNVKSRYRIFVSHGGDDIWVAEQLARCIEDCRATAFLDRRDIAAGDNFKQRIHDEIPMCDELLALFTPWSRRRAWVRHEIGMADMLKKRIVCVFYRVTVADFLADEDGLGPLDGLNTVDINNIDRYFTALRRRAK